MGRVPSEVDPCPREPWSGVLQQKKNPAKDEKLLAQLEVHMEIVVVAFAFILEDFAELFVEYFCVEKYITGYDYEKETAQSFTAAVSSITLNLIGRVS